MLCAGVVHGDLSEFNILLAADGPVIIDLPQAVDAAGNNHAQRMLLRDVDNLRDFFGRSRPSCSRRSYGAEIWELYERGALHPRGRCSPAASSARPARSTWAACCARSTTRRPKTRRAGCGCRRPADQPGLRNPPSTQPVALPVVSLKSGFTRIFASVSP